MQRILENRSCIVELPPQRDVRVLEFARREGGPALRELTFAQRGELLKAMSKVLRDNREELLDLSRRCNGTTAGDGAFDVDGASGTLSFYAGVGRSLDAFIDVRLLPATDPEDFERRVANLTAVREVAFLTGRFDFQMRVACRDAEDLNETVRAIRQSGASGTETRIVLRSARFERAPV